MANDIESRWTCPNDRQLVLRAKLNSGWSFHSTNPAKKATKANISEAEQEIIKNVIQRSDRIQQQEENRVGRLVEKLDNLRKNAMGNGEDLCLLCASKFGILKTVAKECDICEKNVCEKCGVDTHNSIGQPIWLCMLCSEQRELWKKTGAWFFKAIPKYSISDPSRDNSSSLARSDTGSSHYSDHYSDGRSGWTPVAPRRSKDPAVNGDALASIARSDDDASSSDDEMLLDRHKRSRASTGSVSTVSDDFSIYRDSPSNNLLDAPSNGFRSRTGRVSPQDKMIIKKRASRDDGRASFSSPDDADGQKLLGFGDEEDIDELVRNYKENESHKKSDNSSGLGSIEFTLRYQKLDSRLDVVLQSASDLKPMDVSGTSDPYVKLHLLPGASKSNKLRSQTKYKTLNPVFDETLTYHGITEEEISSKTLRLQVYDEDTLGRNDFIGETSVNLKVLNSTPTQSFKRNLLAKSFIDTGKESPSPSSSPLGRIQLSLRYNAARSMLFVGIIRCSALAAMDANGYSDPYVKCYLKPDPNKKTKRRTTIKKKTLNPEFNEEFAYEITHNELAKKSLEVTVWDHDVGKSNDFIGGVVLHIKAEGTALKHWYETLKNPNQLHIQWHDLETMTVQDD